MGFKIDWTLIGKTGVQSGAVVKGLDVIEDGGASCSKGGEAMMIDQFVFESAPKGFDKGVVVAVAFAAHGREQTVLGEHLSVGGAGELSTAIGVDDERLTRAALG